MDDSSHIQTLHFYRNPKGLKNVLSEEFMRFSLGVGVGHNVFSEEDELRGGGGYLNAHFPISDALVGNDGSISTK